MDALISPTYIISEPTPDPRSTEQHNDLASLMRRAGAHVIDVPLVPHGHDSVFIKDSAVLATKLGKSFAFGANPTYADRRAEQEHRFAAFRNLGIEVVDVAKERFEGGDFVKLPDNHSALMGYGLRSDRASASQLAQCLGLTITPLELRDRELFHLDLVISALSDGTLFACREGLTDDAWKTLNGLSCFDKVVPITYEEALDFALNWVEINNKIILGRKVPRLFSILESLGHEVLVTRLEQFHRLNGGAACLVNKIHQLT